jgi:hypothetical protein
MNCLRRDRPFLAMRQSRQVGVQESIDEPSSSWTGEALRRGTFGAEEVQDLQMRISSLLRAILPRTNRWIAKFAKFTQSFPILDRKVSEVFATRITSLNLSVMNRRPSKCSSDSSLVLSNHPQCHHGASDRLVLRAVLHGWPPVSSVALKQIASCRAVSPSVLPVTTCRRSRRLRGEPRRIASGPRGIAGNSWGIPSHSRLRIGD